MNFLISILVIVLIYCSFVFSLSCVSFLSCPSLTFSKSWVFLQPIHPLLCLAHQKEYDQLAVLGRILQVSLELLLIV